MSFLIGWGVGQVDNADGLDEGAASGHGQRSSQVLVGADETARLHGESSGTFQINWSFCRIA